MGNVTVKFLGEEFQVPETINEFLHYDEILTPVREKILKTLSQDIKKDSRQLTFGEHTPNYIDSNTTVYQKLMEECADVLVNKLFALDVYDVTADELLSKTTSIADLNELKMSTLQNMLSEGQKFVDMKKAGMERAYRSAASNITGTGVMIFSSSIASLMLHSVVEQSILLSQAKQADREYEAAVRAINESTRYALDNMVSQVMVKQYYPSVMNILTEFDTKIMSTFLAELVQHDKFDFSSVEKYNMKKAEQMLSNINRVPDKVAFLKQVFDVCPFSLDVYELCLEQGLLDEETFKTAEYFGFADNLVEKMDEYVNQNSQNKKKIEPIISILAAYRNTDETEIWKGIYQDTIENIENNYKKFNLVLTNNEKLDSFVREYIDSNMMNVAQKSKEDVSAVIRKILSSVVSEDRYSEFSEMGLISPEKLRVVDSKAGSLSEINSELSKRLTIAVMIYIEEANHRLKLYEEAKVQLDKKIDEMQDELNTLKTDRENLGIFAFSKKKELALAIEDKTKQISEYERTHETKKLWNDFERMYK